MSKVNSSEDQNVNNNNNLQVIIAIVTTDMSLQPVHLIIDK